MKMTDFTNAELNLLTHVFYNGRTNEMLFVDYMPDLEVFANKRYSEDGAFAVELCSLQRLVNDRRTEMWEFLGVL